MERVEVENEVDKSGRTDVMPEAEVSLRLALFLLTRRYVVRDVRVAIDGAQVQVGSRSVFDIRAFLASRCHTHVGDQWRGLYQVDQAEHRIEIHSIAGMGDVDATLTDGTRLWVECKKGPLTPSKSSAEYPILREAIGQILTNAPGAGERVAVAGPHYGRFVDLSARCRVAPLVRQAGISLLTVSRDGDVFGWPEDVPWAHAGDHVKSAVEEDARVP